MIELLGNTQTLLGVIATLAILCLFVVSGEGNKDGSSGNFIFQLISSIGSDVDCNLQRQSNANKSRAAEKKADVYKRCGINKLETATNVESYLFSICLKSDKSDLKQRLSSSYQKIDIVSRKILDSSDLNNRVDENGSKFTAYYKLRQEPRLIALMVFLVSILFLLLDVFSFESKFVVPFMWLFMLNVLVFSAIIWANHFSHSYEVTGRNNTRRLFLHILCGLTCLVVPSAGFAFLLYLPFDALAIVFAIVFYVAVVSFLCAPMYKRYWNKHEYSRTIILKHIVYFCITAAVGMGVLLYMDSHYPYPAYMSHVVFFRTPLYARYILYLVLLADLIFIPVYGGYLHMKIDEIKTVKRIKKRESLFIRQLDEAVDNLYDIVKEIMIIEHGEGIQEQDTHLELHSK